VERPDAEEVGALTPQTTHIRQLHRDRPKSWFLRLNLLVLVLLFVAAWIQLNPDWSSVFSQRRLQNLKRFAGEVYPYELCDQPFSLSGLWRWCAGVWNEKGAEATKATFSISVLAIILASFGALSVVFLASRNVATPQPFLPSGGKPPKIKLWFWTCLRSLVRGVFVLARAVPEYIWAFLLIGMLGQNAWPAIIALALHNFGILGKLGAEVVENVDPAVPRALRGQGMSRFQISVFALFPMSFPKWLLFFFYRWETCIREAVVLGILGITSLGLFVVDARTRDRYDQMVMFILLGAFLVLIGDLVSVVARRLIRRA
jgi:phosphonate transport system permease protein